MALQSSFSVNEERQNVKESELSDRNEEGNEKRRRQCQFI